MCVIDGNSEVGLGQRGANGFSCPAKHGRMDARASYVDLIGDGRWSTIGASRQANSAPEKTRRTDSCLLLFVFVFIFMSAPLLSAADMLRLYLPILDNQRYTELSYPYQFN